MFNVYGKFVFGRSITINSFGIDVFVNSHITVCKNAILVLGDFSGLSSSSIFCAKRIEIGRYVNIGAGCLIIDTDFHSLNWKDRENSKKDIENAKTAPVKIEDYAFIGARSIICKGVHIGACSIIAAGSVVVKDVPQNELWGGNPARYIRRLK